MFHRKNVFFQIIMANSDWFFVFPEVTLGAKKNLEAESVTWLLRLTITYYSSCVQQKQRKERRKTWNHKKTKTWNQKIPWTSKASSTENCKKTHKNKTKRCDRSSKQLFIHTTNKTRKTNKKNTLTTILHPKNYRETAVLIGICVDFLSVYFRKIQPGFL